MKTPSIDAYYEELEARYFKELDSFDDDGNPISSNNDYEPDDSDLDFIGYYED